MAEAEQSAVSVGAAMAVIEGMQPQIDVVAPHMFCLEGMTLWSRSRTGNLYLLVQELWLGQGSESPTLEEISSIGYCIVMSPNAAGHISFTRDAISNCAHRMSFVRSARGGISCAL